MRTTSIYLSIIMVSCVLGCGSGDPQVVEDPYKMTFTTGEFEVPMGDSFTCFYTNVFTDRELSVVNSSAQQKAGGHHILVMYNNEQPREPGYHECSDSEMVNLRQIAGGSGEAQADGKNNLLELPEGLAIKVPAGKQLVLQAHYINTTPAAQKVNDTVTLYLADPANIKAYVNYLVTLDEGFQIPPHSPYSHTTVCTIDRDFQTILHLGHMHELGTHYKLEIIDDLGNSVQTLRDEAWQPSFASHPPVTRYTMEEPLLLLKGTKLRQTCSWDNITADPIIFPREMCLSFSYYYPAEGDFVCDSLEVAQP